MCGFLRRLSSVEESFTGWPDRLVTSAARSPPEVKIEQNQVEFTYYIPTANRPPKQVSHYNVD